MELQIIMCPIESLHIDPSNARRHDKKNLEAIMGSLKQFGQVEPLVVQKSTGKVIGGNGRIEAMKSLGWKDVEVVEIDVDEVESISLGISLNRTAELGTWDTETLGSLLEGLQAQDIDLIGWDDSDMKELLSSLESTSDGLTDDDEVPEPPKDPKTKMGELWLLGGHRLLCGDSTNKKDVDRLMDGKKANLTMTSPPYWVGKDYEKENSNKEIDDFVKSVCENIELAMQKDCSRIIINSGTGLGSSLKEESDPRVILLIDKWINNLMNHKWTLRHIRHWIKGGGGGGPRSPKTDTVYSGMEYLMTFYHPSGEKRGMNRVSEPWAQQSNWNDIAGDKQENKAGFPVELPQRFIQLYSLNDEIVYDPFGGNGTTMIASEKNNRKCFMMEFEEIYCDVIIQRWAEFTGNDPLREDGAKWSDINESH